MITSPRPNLYESTDGFSVEVLGRTGLCYRRGPRKVFIDSEVVIGSAGMAVYRDSIAQWDEPHQSDAVDEIERVRILHNIRDLFRTQGFEITII